MSDDQELAAAVVIEARRVSAGYGGKRVIADVDLAVGRGECVAVIGPNGSGKSTLLRTLAGVLTPLAGEVLLAGKPVRSYERRQLARRLTGVPAELNPAFAFRVRDVVAMGRHPWVGLFGDLTAADREAIADAMQATGVTELAERYFDELSSGERQRVALAKALAQQASTLLLDEPTAHLDLSHATQLLDLLKHLQVERGLALVLVSHDLNLAAEYADRLLLLHKGRPRGYGPPEEVLDYQLIEETYETIVVVETNPVSGRPRVVPVSRWSLERARVKREEEATSDEDDAGRDAGAPSAR